MSAHSPGYVAEKKAQGHGMSILPDYVAALWATPTLNGNHNAKGMSENSGDGLSTQVKGVHASIAETPGIIAPVSYPAPSLWQTPVAADSVDRKNGKVNSRGEPKLSAQALWATPRASDGPNGGPNQRGSKGDLALPAQAAHALWVTPSTRDWKDTPGMSLTGPDGRNRTDQLPRPVGAIGMTTNGSSATTAKRGALNPEFVFWLMGFPDEWVRLRPAVTPSSRKSPRKS